MILNMKATNRLGKGDNANMSVVAFLKAVLYTASDQSFIARGIVNHLMDV